MNEKVLIGRRQVWRCAPQRRGEQAGVHTVEAVGGGAQQGASEGVRTACRAREGVGPGLCRRGRGDEQTGSFFIPALQSRVSFLAGGISVPFHDPEHGH